MKKVALRIRFLLLVCVLSVSIAPALLLAAGSVPPAPKNIKVSSVGDQTATITFDPVTSVVGQYTFDPNANFTTDFYVVTTHSSKGDITYTPISTTSFTVPNLQNDIAYTATVVAKNAVGSSPDSIPSLPFTPKSANSTASSVTAVAGDTQATVTFPTTTGSSPATYTVTASPGGITASDTKSPIVVPGLKNDTPYTFIVTRTDSTTKNDLVGETTTPVTPKSGLSNASPTSANGIESNLNLAFKLDNPIQGSADLPSFVQTILKAVALLLTPVVVIMMLYSGFLFVTALGNAEKLGEAKQALLYTMIGAAVVLGAEGFATIIKSTVGCLAGGTGC
ncbi:MAG: hypothetical protein WCG55_01860 [bacterium]